MRTKLLILLAISLLAAPAHAANGQKGDWEFGPYAGYGVLDDYRVADPDNDFLYGGRVGYFFTDSWSLEASYQKLSTETGPGAFDFDVTSARLNLLYTFTPGRALRWHVTAGVGSEKTEVGSFFDESDIGYNAGGGLRWFFTDHVAFRADERIVFTNVGGAVDENQTNFETTVGISWLFGGGPPPDADGDGVPDRKDQCPDTPHGAKVDANGCPTDADGDGVFDGLDQCPDTPKGWPVDAKGCPTDRDGDGVADGADKCADTPRGATVDANGCPSDADGDGVLDGIDKCPDTPRGATVDAKGCPSDSDGDGVLDGLDKCPGTPRGKEVDASGCPIPEPPKAEPEIFKESRTLVLEGVTFETSSAKLTSDAKAVLDRVAGSLKDWPEIHLEVSGHTDSTGSAAYNQKLSQQRADSVREYLVGAGIAADHITAVGHGQDEPIADNATREGRAKNRRVELKKLD